MGELDGKVAIITGAGSGIGAASAKRFAQEGAAVIAADIHGKAAQVVADDIRAAGGSAVALAFDLGDEASIRQLIDEGAAAFGGLDILFNNAADTYMAVHRDKPILHVGIDVWDDTMRINVRGTMLCTKYAIPHLLARGGGAIVNTASDSGLAGDVGQSAYGVSKAAVIRMTTYVALDHGKQGIRCNAIAPGLIVTPAVADTYAAGRVHDLILRQHLTPRLGLPEDIANAALFLASDRAAFITGQVLCVDGGLLSHLPYVADVSELLDDQFTPPVSEPVATSDQVTTSAVASS